MITYVAFLRAINVGGHNKIKMEDLRTIFEIRGIKNIRSYIQSGNIIFECAEKDAEKLTITIEQKLQKNLGYAIDVVLRTCTEIKQVIDNNPFPNIEAGKEWQIYVCFLKDMPDKKRIMDVEKLSYEHEKFAVIKNNLYALCNKGENLKLLFTNNFIEKKLAVPATGRNWNTVNKIYAMMHL